MKRYLHIVFCFFSLYSCYQPLSHVDNHIQDTSVSAQNNQAALIGYGYDSDKEHFLRPCVEGKVVYSGTSSSSLSLDRSLRYDELLARLGLSLSGRASFAVIDVSGSTKFAINSARTKYKDALIFSVELKGKNAMLSDITLNKRGQDIAKSANIKKVRATCGDEFVEQIELGGKLFISVTFEFANSELKTQFHSQAKFALASLFEIEGKINTALEQFQDNVTISISALQIGGSVDRLSEILSSKGQDGNLFIFRCSLENRTDCSKALNRMLVYASEDFPTQFRKMHYLAGKAEGAAFLRYQTRNYYDFGVMELYPEKSPILAMEIDVSRQKILQTYQKEAKDGERVQNLLQFFRLNKEEFEKISNISHKIASNKIKLVRVGQLCYERPLLCVVEANKLYTLRPDAGGLDIYHPRELVKKLTFYDYCQIHHESPSIEHTVKVIRETLAMQNESCQTLETELRAMISLDLSNKNIVNISPLEGLTHLKNLDLSKNKLRSIGVLNSFRELEFLDLSSNSIDSIKALKDLEHLKKLNLSTNRLFYITPLEELHALKTLWLVGNNLIDEQSIDMMRKHNPNLLIFRDSFDICEAERRWLKEQGLIDHNAYRFYQALDLGPFYKDEKRSDPQDHWYRCEFVFHTYIGHQ